MTKTGDAEPAVLVERTGHVCVLTINRPDARNAINTAVTDALGLALQAADDDPEVRAIVLTGAGHQSFCAGADLKALARGENIGASDPEHQRWGFAGVVSHPVSTPVIAAVNGTALGGGTELVLAADLAIAAESASFGLPEVKRGLFAAAGGAFRIVDAVPKKVAMELLLTGRPISAEKAKEYGLINDVVPDGDLVAAVMALATEIAGNAPLAVQASKRLAQRDTIDLLWRNEIPGKRRGRPPKFSSDEVVDVAITVADRTGSSFSLRDVAAELGTPVMSLYSYVQSREQLLDLMSDDVRATMAHRPLTGGWREQLAILTDDNLALFTEHPWLADLESEREILGPGTLAKYEHELTVVEPLPLPDTEKDAVLTLLCDFARANARAMTAARKERTQEDPADWWEREGAKLAVLGIEARFPLATRVGAASGEAQGAARDADTAYRFGLQLILDGLASRLTV